MSVRFPSWNEAILPIDLPISDVLDKVDSLRRFDPRRVQLHQLLIDPIADLLPQNPEDAIVSLWAVPDAPTADLTLAFYQNWQETSDKATALRSAMLTMMETHPNLRD